MGSLFSILILYAIYQMFRGSKGTGSYLKRLDVDLRACQEKGLLDALTREKVFTFVSALPRGHRMKAATGLAILAGISVVAGISLIVAHNWQQLGAVVRLVGFLLLYVGIVEGTLRFKARANVIRYGGEILWFFLPLLGIGLYAQTFHLSGNPLRPFLVWLALSLPLVWCSEDRILGVLHVLCLGIVLSVGNFVVPGGELTLTLPYGVESTAIAWRAWLLSAIILGVMGIEAFRFLPAGNRNHFIGFAFLWVFLLLVCQTPFQVKHGSWWLVAVVSLTTLWSVAPLCLGGSGAERGVASLSWLLTIYGMTYLWHNLGSFGLYDQGLADAGASPGGLLVLVLSAAAVVGVFLIPPEAVPGQPLWRRLLQAAFIVTLALAYVLVTKDREFVKTVGIVANVLFAALGVGWIAYGMSAASSRAINVGVVMVALLMITRFFDLFGTMLQSGVGFIVSGLFLAGMALLVEKGRKNLLNRAARETP